MDINDLLTVREFAKKIRVHPNTVYLSIKNGHISAFRVGCGKRSSFRIPASEMDRMALVNLEVIVQKMVETKN